MIGRHNHICARKTSNSFSGKSLIRNRNEIEMQTFHETALFNDTELLFEKEVEKDHNKGSNIFDTFSSVMLLKKQHYSNSNVLVFFFSLYK